MMQTTPFSVGLTGGIGCGKSTVADLFASRGAAVIDTDLIAHRITAPDGLAMPAIRVQFGKEYITAAGALDRQRMRARVFADNQAKRKLESILHPMIRSECERDAAAAQGSYLMFVVPLLVESPDWRQRVSRILVVDCPEQQQIARVMKRSGLSEPEVRAIMANQVSRAERLAAADDVIANDEDLAHLVAQVDRLHAQYRSIAQNSL